MTTDSSNQNHVVQSQWTSVRLKIAGISGIVGGVVLITTWLLETGLDVALGRFAQIASVLAYILLLITLLGAVTRYDLDDSRMRQAVVLALAVGLIFAMSLHLTLALGDLAPRGILEIGGLLWGVAFTTLPFLTSLFGIVLWRTTTASRLVAGSFVAVVPAAVAIYAALYVFPGTNAMVIGYDLLRHVAFVTLGYALWTNGLKTTTGSTEVHHNS